MINTLIGLISFAAIFGGALAGLFVRRRLPTPHLSSETQAAVTVSVAVIGTLSALVLGLMVHNGCSVANAAAIGQSRNCGGAGFPDQNLTWRCSEPRTALTASFSLVMRSVADLVSR